MRSRASKQCESQEHHTFHAWGGGLYYCPGVEIVSPPDDDQASGPKAFTMDIGPVGQEVWDLLTLPKVKLTTPEGHTIEGLLKADGQSYQMINYAFTCGEHDSDGNHITP